MLSIPNVFLFALAFLTAALVLPIVKAVSRMKMSWMLVALCSAVLLGMSYGSLHLIGAMSNGP